MKIQLRDEFGNPVVISTHQFRHSVGTNLINNNVSLLHVQKFLGHRNPMMTMAYAEIHDKTLKDAVMQSAVKMTDIRGKIYDPTDIFNDVYDQDITGKEWCENNINELNKILLDVFEIKISNLGNPIENRGKLYFEKGSSKNFPFDNLSSGESEE